MAGSIITYDRDLPEIPDRRPWEVPDCYLVKNLKAPGGWRIEDTGRRARLHQP